MGVEMKVYRSGLVFCAMMIFSGLSLLALSYFSLDYLVLIPVVMYFVWDLLFFLNIHNTHDRGSSEYIQQLRASRTTMAGFITIYAALIAAIFALGDESPILDNIISIDLHPYLIIAPFIIASITSLYLPVVWTVSDTNVSDHKIHPLKVSSAMRALVATSMFGEKVVVYIFAYTLLRIFFNFSETIS